MLFPILVSENIPMKKNQRIKRYENYESLPKGLNPACFLNFVCLMKKYAKLLTGHTVCIVSLFLFHFLDSRAILLFGLLPNDNFRLNLSTEWKFHQRKHLYLCVGIVL